ncbi:MAG TPA: SRPBCC family protein [Elusimicrobiota bacterium]|nr:SRPBCC family protein [Elusimicrobiota bacterium]
MKMTRYGGLLAFAAAWAAMTCRPGTALAGQEPVVSVEQTGPRTCRIEGRFSVEASSRTAWQVLTDYEGLPRFVSSMRVSRIAQRRPGGVLLEQEAVAKAYLLSRSVSVLLDVREDPERGLAFEDVSHRDFEFYRGRWRIEGGGAALSVRYELEARRKFAAPGFVARGAFRKNAEALLRQVRAEIARRAAERSSHGTSN